MRSFRWDGPIDTPDVAPPLTRAEIHEALANMAATARRLPIHFVDKRAAIHQQINELLDQLDCLDLEP